MDSPNDTKVVESYLKGTVLVVKDLATNVKITKFLLPKRSDVAVHVLCDADGRLKQVVLSNGHQTVILSASLAAQTDRVWPPTYVCTEGSRLVGEIVAERPDMVLAHELCGSGDFRLSSYYGSVDSRLLAFIHQHFPATATAATTGGAR